MAAADIVILVAVFVLAREEALLTWTVISPFFVYQGTMPLMGKRETIRPVPITLQHVQLKRSALHAP
jgi:hypothetical protein